MKRQEEHTNDEQNHTPFGLKERGDTVQISPPLDVCWGPVQDGTLPPTSHRGIRASASPSPTADGAAGGVA